jgi:hypothetical protein
MAASVLPPSEFNINVQLRNKAAVHLNLQSPETLNSSAFQFFNVYPNI